MARPTIATKHEEATRFRYPRPKEQRDAGSWGLVAMVARVMTARLRLLVGLLALVTFIGLTVHVVASASDEAAPTKHEVVTGASMTNVVPALARAVRPLRSVSPSAGRSIGMVLALAAGLVAVGARSRRARRIADTGDSWRSLLLGAPPVLSSF